ncbi:response regulator transcription factor [Bacillus subtilis]|nr:response regulator transcription factor [Bacillus subtilis]
MNKDKIRVALADDQPLVREGFRYIINAQPDMTVSGEAGDGHDIIALAKQTKPDVILMDVQMPHCSGIEAAKDIMSALSDTKIVILTTKRELEVLQQMAYGLRNEDIAEKLFVSESTVKTHVHRILQKCNAQDRTQAVVFAIRNGIVQ